MKKSLTPNRFNFTTYTYNFLQTLTWIETTTKNEVFIVHLDLGGRCGEGDGWQRWFSDICLPCLNWVTFSLSWRRPICWSFICTHQVKFVLPLKGHVRICSDKNHKSLDKVIHKNSTMQSPMKKHSFQQPQVNDMANSIVSLTIFGLLTLQA